MVPACLGEKFVQLGLWAFSELGGGGELEERGRKGALSCDRQESGPARNPAGDRGRSGCGRNSRGLRSREQAQELHGLSAKPAARHLHGASGRRSRKRRSRRTRNRALGMVTSSRVGVRQKRGWRKAQLGTAAALEKQG